MTTPFLDVIGFPAEGERVEPTPRAYAILVEGGWEPPKPAPTDQQMLHYKPGCSRSTCVCQTPPPVCHEYLEDWRDENCVRCGWTAVKHPVKP
jgi:hypothetical protein